MLLVENLFKKWLALSVRERAILGVGAVLLVFILGYQFLYRPLTVATTTMEQNIGSLRSNLVWLREQVELGVEGNSLSTARDGAEQSLVSVLEKVARANNLEDRIQQLTPGDTENQVRVVLDEASFNSWVQWVSVLEQQYGVIVESADVERLSEPDSAEIRMQLMRD